MSFLEKSLSILRKLYDSAKDTAIRNQDRKVRDRERQLREIDGKYDSYSSAEKEQIEEIREKVQKQRDDIDSYKS